MSKLKRLLGALSLVSLFIFSSCVEDSVAPEVTALRQAQVDLLNADIAFRNAQTALQTAQAEAQSILNAFNSANNAIILSSNQADLDSKLSALEVTLATAAVTLVEKEQELLEAQADLELYLATAGIDQAAFYLAQWSIVMFGADAVAPDQAALLDLQDGTDIVVGTSVFDLRDEIIALENKIAIAQLFLSEDDETLTRAYVTARLQEALVLAEAALAGNTAALAAYTAELEALEANDVFAAVAELEAALIPLFQDSIDALEAFWAAEAAFAAAEGEVGAAEAVIEDFEDNRDLIEFWPNTDRDRNFRESSADTALYTALAAAYGANVDLWNAYADSLQAVYDDLYPLYAESFDAELALLAADTLAEWEATQGASDQIIDDMEVAFAEYVIAWNTIVELNVGGPGNYLATPGDTLNLIDAREAWDGVNSAQLLQDGSGSAFTNLNNGDGDMMGGSNFGTLADPTTLDATDGAVQSGLAVGGAFKFYFDLIGGSSDLFDAAVIRFEEAYAIYMATVNEFATLQAYINAVKGGSENTGLYDGTVSSVITDLSDLVEIQFVSEFITRIGGLNDEAADAFDGVSSFPDFCTIYEMLGYGDCPDTLEDRVADLGDAPTTAKEANDYLAASNTALAEAELDVAYAVQIVAPFIDAYLAAVEIVNAEDPVQEAYNVSLVAPRLAVETASGAYWVVVGTQDLIRFEISELERLAGTVIVNGEDYTEIWSIEDQIESVKAQIAGIDIDADEDAVEAATNAIATDAIEQVRLEDVLARDQAELEAKQTELSVMESLAASLQALLEAALAG